MVLRLRTVDLLLMIVQSLQALFTFFLAFILGGDPRSRCRDQRGLGRDIARRNPLWYPRCLRGLYLPKRLVLPFQIIYDLFALFEAHSAFIVTMMWGRGVEICRMRFTKYHHMFLTLIFVGTCEQFWHWYVLFDLPSHFGFSDDLLPTFYKTTRFQDQEWNVLRIRLQWRLLQLVHLLLP